MRWLGLGVFGCACAWAWACLPDLAIAPGHVAPSFCGDGFIDVDASEQCDPGDSGAQGCTGCRVACTGGYVDDASNHCYFSVGFTSTSDAAAATCGEAGAHVVSIVNDVELRMVARNAPSGLVWVGLKEQGSLTSALYLPFDPGAIEPGWTPKCRGCYASEDDAGTIPPDPQGTIKRGACVVAQGITLPWMQSLCGPLGNETFARTTICEREPSGSRTTFCVGEGPCFTVPMTQSTKTYVLVATKLSAADAPGACASLGGKLAVLTGRPEREEVMAELAAQSPPVTEVWIGLSLSDAGTWGWDDDPQGVGAAPVLLWAIDQPPGNAPPGARAFLATQAGAIDSELAHAGGASDARYALCEL